LTTAYCLVALILISVWGIWLPGVLPLSAIWVVALFSLFAPCHKDHSDFQSVVPHPSA